MSNAPTFDLSAAHRYFATHCFNQAWGLIEKTDRTPEEDQLMVALSHASIYHWLNRHDCTKENLSIGYWQVSRIQAILGNAAEAQRAGQTCLENSTELEPFYRGYAYEALARAALLALDAQSAANYLAQADANAALVEEQEDRETLQRDLDGLRQA